MRLAAYAAERSNVVRALLQRMATLPEAIEIGRVTGLTLGQVMCSQVWRSAQVYASRAKASDPGDPDRHAAVKACAPCNFPLVEVLASNRVSAGHIAES